MRNLLTIIFSLIVVTSNAQVGINTDTPKASLEIAVDPDRINQDGTEIGAATYENGGMILGYPGENNSHISELSVVGITELQRQQILMRDSETGKIQHMDRYALNYFPGRPSHISLPIVGLINIPINTKDHTILVRGNIELPTGNEYIGKTLHLIYDSQEEKPFKISGPMKYNAYLTNELYISRVNAGYELHSDGTKWFVIGGFEQEDNEEVELVTLYDGETAQVKDNKILVKGNISLPSAAIAGYELTLAYNGDGNNSFTINSATSPIMDGTTSKTSYTLSKAINSKSVKLQSNGTHWVVMAKR